MPQAILDNQAIAQLELNQYIDQQAQDLAPDYEIDSAEDGDFGPLYRLWKSYIFLGSFYQNLSGKWVAQPANSDCRAECDTEYQAQLVILAIQGLVVPAAA
ncbi:hypothetical protein VF14_02970 [Nostoc linckia z18]|uniref:Uncharacterized protein n=2 Tax=Nostoc linckia TaxID=92942 RepID=A0A9Q6ENS9_NOSLI|nr:hypothetical protein [Nostoc linckia]PHK42346.1 hypothetical protein VF12_02985 [Nostoc linckia z15]PHK46787.1 hypothetical protein VF13_08855 [Nostoc linckia z16]PHJ69116.1 hypothetical protein VF02_00440 [Nostoc linckia z1]PHJ73267.1 hypothetical protein VF05_01455 [Nostoc linckia z3]PHJ78614.1 hypothetical protein VF03_00440 [Nostoc linckia z2]